MKYSVIHSNDPYLLARMATDLQMSWYNPSIEWCQNQNYHPFDDNIHTFQSLYLHTVCIDGFKFHNHGWCPITEDKDRHELTESNYLQVLEAVLS